jgi:hypothetical protein
MRFILVLVLTGSGLAAAEAPAQWSKTPPSARSVAGSPQLHPAGLIKHAAELWKAGRRDDAVFWFYLGQLRYRAYLAAHPDLPKDRDPALFASLMEVVGRPVNEYAFGDLPALARTIGEVLAWDDAHPDAMTPKDTFGPQRDRIRRGLAQMRDEALAQADQIRATRVRNGLTNRN